MLRHPEFLTPTGNRHRTPARDGLGSQRFFAKVHLHATTPQEDRRIALPELWLCTEEPGSTTLPRMRRGLSGDTGQSRPRPINVAGVVQSGRAVLEHAHVDQAHHLASRVCHHVQRRLHGRPENSEHVRWFSEHTRTQSHAL